MKIIALLKQLGFSENETRVYLASLEMGISSAQSIAKKAGTKRTTAYAVLNALVERGVVGKTKDRGKIRFVPEPPQKLLSIISELQTNLQKSLPELEAVYNTGETKPKIIFFEGDGAIEAMYEDTLRDNPREILMWLTDLYFENFPKNANYIDKRVKQGISAKRIAGKGSVWHLRNKRYDKEELSETIIVEREHLWPKIEVNIYNNKIAFTNFADKMTVIIESKTIADAMRQVYELSWLGAKSIEVK